MMTSVQWWLVRWNKKHTNVVRTDWYKSDAQATAVAKRESAKGNEVTDFRSVSGNGKRQ